MKTKLLALCVALSPSLLTAQELAAPEGMVLLTVAGDIKVSNRGAPHFLEDPFISFHELEFETAAEFDQAMLEALPSRSANVRLSKWPEPSLMEGPALSAVLDAVQAAGSQTISFVALDGFRVEMTAEQAAAKDWFVAIKRDGQPLGIGAHGPTWVMFPPAAEDFAATREESSQWPWTAFYMEVGPSN